VSEGQEDHDQVYATLIDSVAELPPRWDENCRPWGERDPYDRTIGDQLNN
jgi:hypothetical protein